MLNLSSSCGFLKNPQILHIFEALSKHNIEARFVGGCVRDALLGIEIHDLDMAATGTPQELKGALELEAKNNPLQKPITIIPTGIDHGTQTLILDGLTIEVTNLRKDINTDGRHAIVIFGGTWEEDAARRDFTINALYMDGQGNLFDPTGQGIDDLKKRHIRFIGDAQQRIKEDFLRILRYFRFQAFYGKTEPGLKCLNAIKSQQQGLSLLSIERITSEILRLLQAANPYDSIHLMDELGVLKTLFGKHYNFSFLQSLKGLEESIQTSAFYLTRLFGFLSPKDLKYAPKHHPDAGRPLLRLSGSQEKFGQQLMQSYERLYPIGPNVKEGSKEIFVEYGAEFLDQALLFTLAHAINFGTIELEEAKKLFSGIHAKFKDRSIPIFPINGDNLKILGIQAGPEMGAILTACKQWWIREDFKPNHTECVEWVRGYLNSKKFL